MTRDLTMPVKTDLRPTHRFVARVRATCRRRRLLSPGDRVLVALSGGPDSTALLVALATLRDRGDVAAVAAAHVDHQLRPGSAVDAVFCRDLCERFAVPFEPIEVTVAEGNVQAQARRVRYAALRRAAARIEATRIATGHTRSDQAETVILRIVRGAGARGLAAIPPRRGVIVRPIIDRTRDEVLEFLSDSGLEYREDPTNASHRYLRNRVRAEVLPLLKKLNPSVECALSRAADLLREDEWALDRAAARLVSDEGAADSGFALVDSLRTEAPAVRRRAVRRLWRRVTGSRKGLTAAHVEAALALTVRVEPGVVTLPRGLEARFAYGKLTIRRRPLPDLETVAIEVPGPGIYDVPGRNLRVDISSPLELTNPPPSRVAWPLVLRSRRPGDRLRPAGGRGSKTLKRWLIDRKVPREMRDRLVLLVDEKGEVLWIPELSVRSAVLAEERSHLELRVIPAQ